MPQVFKIGSYLIYFWTNEGKPVEPVHIHVTCGVPCENDTKIWITKAGGTIVAHNKSQIPAKKLTYIEKIIVSRKTEIIEKWKDYFGDLHFYC
ncbi:MAG: DUF4160 domain-containing protein [Treponemataceae bacterium]|nr:DUF4160 domain-containing protein [Treponemataceae bacterium]